MLLRTIMVGGIETNCYLVADAATKEAMLIDPGDEPDKILDAIATEQVTVKYIVLTHGHGDHIAALGAVKEATGAEVCIHAGDAGYLTDPKKSMLAFMGQRIKTPPADRLLNEGDVVQVGNLAFKVLHTPGHTPGGISLVGAGVVFSGDTLFAGSIGRTDFPGGSYPQLIQSAKTKLLTLPGDTAVYPGHGPESTIAEERAGNPFLR